MPPNLVKDFLKAAKLKADYFFAVLNKGIFAVHCMRI